ncbi:DUF6438 domain-containing protein [Sphingomicrobium sediminis]|uniref:DUF6438 domain-containing protein n=1 Tax=Sphingomicrobium sediminis TaxID=2950949 RepID=A0A9X2EFT2_9SPHN|nr:DUF6438 domain-containing protein [Sphingomicrobium sediminis]MCM8557178.1 DUF6438 domain-containing protein [Sphingomicrobium sediminis]
MKRLIFVSMAMLALSGCATMAKRPDPPKIVYETTPCFGTCPVYRLGVDGDGLAVFEGMQHTAMKGQRMFAVRPAEFAAFSAALAPYRPDGSVEYVGANCATLATDFPGVRIVWTDNGRTDTLVADFGCDTDANRAMYQAIADAVDVLPLKPYVGR